MTRQRYQFAPPIRRRLDDEAVVPVQRKLAVGSAHDPLEREADDVATDVIVRLARQSNGPGRADGTSDRLQRSDASTTDDARHRSGESSSAPATKIRRSLATAQVGLEGGSVSPEINSRIQRARGGGAAMDDTTRSSMESAFGADFSGVRIHTGSESTKINRSIGAKAFTVGSDVFFSGNSYDPGSRSGQHLLAHELTHTVQQGASSAVESAQRTPAANISTDTDGPVRRWAIGPGLDLGRTRSLRALGSQGQQTYIATDDDGDQVLIKKANIPMNVAQLATLVHESVSPGAIVDSQALDAANNTKLKQKLADPAVAAGPSWGVAANALGPNEIRQGESPDDAARRFHADLIDNGTLLTVQKVVEGGRNAKELAADTRDGDPAWSASQLRYLLNNISYMRQLGGMIATDAFLGNEDRVSHTGANLGNWMTAGSKISRIDNMDVNAVANLTDANGVNGALPEILVEMMKNPSAYLLSCLKGIVKEGKYEGDPGIQKWFADECSDAQKKMMLDDLEIGLRTTMARIDAIYGKGKMSDAGRAAKDAIKDLDLEDDGAGGANQIDFWEILKVRAAYMQNPSKGDKLLKTLRKRHAASMRKRRKKKRRD